VILKKFLILTAIFLLTCFWPAHARENFIKPYGKHDENIETWAFHSKIDIPGKEGALYVGMFFLSGSLYFLNGNFAHIFWLDTTSGDYNYENNIFLPPFEKVKHDTGGLKHKFHDSLIQYNKKHKAIEVDANFSKFCASLSLSPVAEKETIIFDRIFENYPEGRTFNWYMIPRARVNADIDGKYDLTSTGIAHFQNFWGDEVCDSGDSVFVHLDSGYDLIINGIYPPRKERPCMPGDYVMISGPDGNTEKTTDFDYVVHEWWDAKHTKKKYPVRITVTSKIRNLSLEVMVLKKDQTADLLGVEVWLGYADVTGTIDNRPQKGWAFVSPEGNAK
jgi:hypothetical protein